MTTVKTQTEIERRFLVDAAEFAKAVPKTPIVRIIKQGYLETQAGESMRRVRISGPVVSPTLLVTPELDDPEFVARIETKSNIQGPSCTETEEKITIKEGLELLKKCDHYIVKYRVYLQVKDNLWEIDIFEEPSLFNEVIAEVEFKTMEDYEKSLKDMVLPPWVICEITGNRRLSNLNIAVNPEIAKEVVDNLKKTS